MLSSYRGSWHIWELSSQLPGFCGRSIATMSCMNSYLIFGDHLDCYTNQSYLGVNKYMYVVQDHMCGYMYLWFPTCSYLLSKSLEEDSLAPAPSYTAKTLLSPARLRSKLKYLFTAKGAVVSDSHAFTPPLQSHPSHITKQVSDSISCEHLERLDSVDGIARKFQRSTSLSPSIVRRYSEQPVERTRDTSRPHLLMSHVIKVAMTHNDHCNYKCMLVSIVVVHLTSVNE